MSDAIPTTGPGGVRFRSRLEARWAAFFTLLRWPWQYEPDLGLRKWIPDFLIASGNGVLVEVKPVTRLEDFGQHVDRIMDSKVVAPVFIVGAALLYEDREPMTPRQVTGFYGWTGGFSTWSWHYRELGQVALDAGQSPPTTKDAQRLWVKAGNALQWRRM